MTSPFPGQPNHSASDPDAWLCDVTAGLRAARFTADLNDTAAGLDLTAVRRQPGRREVEIVVDGDDYVELRWWTDRGAAPGDVAVSLSRLLAAATAPAQEAP
jgi:hypothetical protein